MLKRIILILMVLGMVICFSSAYAGTIVLPDGQELNIDNLNESEVIQAIKTAQKSLKAKSSSVAEIVKGVNPNDLQAWSKLITSTIKSICEDLSITVNDFVKTPVGIGVAAIIMYQVAGKELLDNAHDIVIMVPLWFLLTGIILFLGWYCFSGKTYYNKIYYNDKGKKVKEGYERQSRFPWKPYCGNDWSPAQTFGCTLITSEIAITIISLMIILV